MPHNAGIHFAIQWLYKFYCCVCVRRQRFTDAVDHQKVLSARCAQFLVKAATRLSEVGDTLGIETVKVMPQH